MPRNTLVIDNDDNDDDGEVRLPPFNPLGFLDLVPRRPSVPPNHGAQQSTQAVPHPSIDIDRIRDEVNEWLAAEEFGAEEVPPTDVDMLDNADANDDESQFMVNPTNTHDYVENLLASDLAIGPDPEPEQEPEPDSPAQIESTQPDLIDESILHDASTSDSEDYVGAEQEADSDVANQATKTYVLPDNTVEITHIRKDHTLTDFQNAFGLWVDLHGISRAAYSQLIEVFRLAQHLDEIRSISPRKETLISQVRNALPISKLRMSTVSLDTERLPTRSKPTERVLSIDLEDTISTLLSSTRVQAQIYKGMAQYTNPKLVRNPWEAPWWGESVRTSSGQFHYYPNGKDPILPSDFVVWKCEPGQTDHVPDRCVAGCSRRHIGRVVWSGRDMGTDQNDQYGRPLLRIQRVYQRGGYIPFHLIVLTARMSHSPSIAGAGELVIVEDSVMSMHPRQIISPLSKEGVYLDYQFSSKDPASRARPCTAPYTVRYVWNEARLQARELRYSSPHRAELELRALGRKHIESFATRDMISLPLHMFVDAFGLYRNMYRSIEGLYFFPQFFDMRIRNRRSSVITATLGPYGAKRRDIFQTLVRGTRLDRGTVLHVNNRPMFVCAFVAAIIGDMPSQQELSGCLGPTASHPCRYCLVCDEEKSDMKFDTAMMGKYHDQIIADRERILSKTTAVTTRRLMLSELGLNENEELFSTLRGLFPALDVIRTRPIDAAHSEYAGISKYVHRLIFQEASTVLTRTALKEAGEKFSRFPTPVGWPKLQSPRTHLESYSIQEYARGIIILPVFLRHWLLDTHVKPNLHRYLKLRAKDYLDVSNPEVVLDSVANIIVACVWTISRSVLATCSQTRPPATTDDDDTSRQQDMLHELIVAGRRAFQLLCQVQSDTSQVKSTNRPSTPTLPLGPPDRAPTMSVYGGHPPTVSHTQFQSDAGTIMSQQSSLRTVPSMRRRRVDPEERINQFLRWKQLPNVHTGLHIAEVAREYGNCMMVFTLMGEDMHKHYKALIYNTNYSNAAATLMNINNRRKAIAYLLAGCFEEQYPHVHRMYQALRTHCPLMANAFDPYVGVDGGDDNTNASRQNVSGDPNHRDPHPLLIINRANAMDRDNPLLQVVTSRDIVTNRDFAYMLRRASERDYDVYMLEPGPSHPQWFKKVSFTTPYGDRKTYSVGMFAKFKLDTDSQPIRWVIARIDGIFTHKRTYSNNVYFCVTHATTRGGDQGSDPILHLPYYDITEERDIIGLPRISSQRLWMVDVIKEGGGLVCVEHNIYFM